jgi:small-conductance mechanosensitive channel
MAVTVYYAPESPTEVVKDDVNCRVNTALNAARIEIPYDYMTVVMNNGQPEDFEATPT